MERKTGKRKEGWDVKKRRDVVAIVLSLTPKLDFTLIQYSNPGAHCYRNCLQDQQRETLSLMSDSRQVRLSWAPGLSRFPRPIFVFGGQPVASMRQEAPGEGASN